MMMRMKMLYFRNSICFYFLALLYISHLLLLSLLSSSSQSAKSSPFLIDALRTVQTGEEAMPLPPPVYVAMRPELNGIAQDWTGKRVAAAVWSAGIYLSIDFGINWKKSSAPDVLQWTAIASDRSLENIVAGAWQNGGLFVSNNYGANWNLKLNGNFDLHSIHGTPDGTHFIASMSQSGVYMSSDKGNNWKKLSANDGSSNNWGAITSSSSGKHIAAVIRGGGIFISSDQGATWTQSNAPVRNWYCISADRDSRFIVAGSEGGEIYVSSDSGHSWKASIVPYKRWSHVPIQVCP